MTRPTWRSALIIVSISAVAGVYLFIQAPPPLAASLEERATVRIETVFALLEHENDMARGLWTEEIVNAGKAQGLTFEEAWRDEGVHSGPLPALFLRETARNLEREAPGLKLFLGSRYPINTANHFSGQQAAAFAHLARDGTPQFFAEPDTKLQTAMFADRAIVEACVRCHNEHKDSPKKDWKLHDIMGATTWMYPDQKVSMQRAVELLAALRRSTRTVYATYLAKTATFPNPPPIRDGWPRDGRQLPSEDVFMRELAKRSSSGTLGALIEPNTIIPEPPPPPKPPVTPPAPEDVLVIHASRATRVTVDQYGSRLLVVRLRAGATATMTAPPPLRVLVDDPASIAVQYRSKPIAKPDVEIVTDEGK